MAWSPDVTSARLRPAMFCGKEPSLRADEDCPAGLVSRVPGPVLSRLFNSIPDIPTMPRTIMAAMIVNVFFDKMTGSFHEACFTGPFFDSFFQYIYFVLKLFFPFNQDDVIAKNQHPNDGVSGNR
jgi:hypothetical protein